jgi:REP-associated tyrosine transposase
MTFLGNRRRGRFVVSALHIHLIFVTKYRCGVPGAEAPEFAGDDDHVHLLAGYQPTVAVSALVNSLQGVSP